MGKQSLNSNKLKILALTGRSAEQIVRKNIPSNVVIKVLPIDVAAFITKELILKNLTQDEAKQFDLIMIPGLNQEDLTELKEYYKIPVVKGPKYASDIKLTLQELDPFELSATLAADKYLKMKKIEEAQLLLQRGFSNAINEEIGEYWIGYKKRFPIGISRPPIVMAEIVDATILPIKEVLARALYYLKSGAEIIDIGATTSSSEPQQVGKIIQELHLLQNKYDFAISIDTLDIEEIRAAIKNNIDLILSIDHGNVEHLISDIPKETGVVFIPTNVAEGIMPKKPHERIESLLKLRDILLESDIKKIAADPIIESLIQPGFTNSLEAYIKYRHADPQTPMMTCVGNVTEFISADAIGINALFGSLAVELGIQFLLATDVSIKCRGGVKEIINGRNLAFVAKEKRTPPKGFGLEILMAKSRIANDMDIATKNDIETIELSSDNEDIIYTLDYEPDPKGNFTIWTDYHQNKIYVIHQPSPNSRPDLMIISSKARLIFEEIVTRNLISKMDHAFYLGRELERAEVCLYLGKTYIQNEQSFK
ncbi:MAG: DUF4346 domain-containing protein [Asgard group archaeon]|nr:DUF4346 domain-containing protein [Asgard group archaeon]